MTARTLRLLVRSGLVSVALALAASCSNSNSSTAPSATLSTDTITGVLNPGGTDSHTFTVNYSSAYTDASITVTKLTTVANGTPQMITIGVGFGTTNVGVCTTAAAFTNPAAPFNTELPTSGSPFIAGQYCVQVFDNPANPTVTEPLNYSLNVKHY
jgi:hypothetical protein